MPDYSYLKKQVEAERGEQDEKVRKAVVQYFEEEGKMVDFAVSKIKKRIEFVVYQFYKGIKSDAIKQKEFFNKEYDCEYLLEFRMCVTGTTGMSFPEDSSPGLNFPDRACLDSFIRRLNEELSGDKISVKISESAFKGEFVGTFHAELGKL